ncbi:hypothetical protein GOBAR_DD34128 [Gossypium barbadense]|nr:hypothetical protein GOBAR_DD34128 [Gossypium barbadense]
MDQLVWQFSTNGRYSVRLAYRVAINMRLDQALFDENIVWAKLWHWKNVGVASIVRAADDFQLCWLQSLGVFVVTSEGGDRAGVSRVGGRAGWEPLTVGMLKCNVDFAGSNKIG